MNIDWELAHAFTVDDGVGVRCCCELPIVAVASSTSDSTTTSETTTTTTTTDTYRIVIGTQGGALYQWSLPSQSLYPIPYQHDNGISSILASSTSNTNIYVTGCKDSNIRLFDATTHVLLRTLQGHAKPVTSLSWVTSDTDTDSSDNTNQYLVSGSWDGTAKIWNVTTGAMVATLPNHENSVSVVGLPSSNDANNATNVLSVATGSAGIAQNNAITNHSVRLWTIDSTTGQVELIRTVANDHDGPIRGMAVVVVVVDNDNDDDQQQHQQHHQTLLATCSNDGTVKMRQVDTADCTATLVASFETQEVPMLLSVTSTPQSTDTMAVAAAEDGHVVFYKTATTSNANSTTATHQLIRNPASVWQVVSLTNGDVATSCQDGYVRIFTQAADRMAPEQVRQDFVEAATAAATASNSGGGGPSAEEVAKLPKWELNALQQGKKEGQVQCFQKNGTTAIAAQWSAASATWIEVGEVVSGPGGGSSGNDNNTIDGVQYDHVLPIEVDQEGGGVAKLQIGYNTGENAFVAAQRFMDAHMMPQHYHSEIANYIQQRVGTKSTVPTLGGPAAVGPSTVVKPAVYQHVPMKGYKSFALSSKQGATYFDKLLGKIRDVGLLSEPDMTTLQQLSETLAATNRYHASQVDPASFSVLETILTDWTPAQAFAALDLARLAVLHPSSTTTWNWNKLLTLAFGLCDKNENDKVAAVPLLTLRLICNCFQGGVAAVDVVVDCLPKVMALTESLVSTTNKTIRLSVTTVLLNVSSYLYSMTLSSSSSSSSGNTVLPVALMNETARQIVVQVNTILGLFKTYESEAVVRTLVALGTVLLIIPTAPIVKETCTSLYLTSKVEMAASPHGEAAKGAAREVYTLLQ